MKVLKIIFSKWSISVLLFLLQVAAVLLVIILANQYFIWFQIISSIVGILVFFFIINKQQNTDYKIPWLFLVLALPIFGTTFYLMFAQNRTKKRDYKFMLHTYEKMQPYLDEIGAPEEAKEYLGEYKGLETYLENTSFTKGSLHNDVKYYPVGELMWQDMLEEL